MSRILTAFLVVLWALYLPRLLASPAPHSTVSRLYDFIGVFAQFTPLAAGSVFAWRSATGLEAGNRARLGWWLLGGWLSTFAIGEAILSAYRVAGMAPPVPCAGDAFFLVGYALLTAGSVWFVGVYASSGLPLGPARERVFVAVGTALVLAVIAWFVLVPVWRAPRPLAEVLVSAGYPVLDFVVLVPTALLVRMTSRFHGGRVWTVWGSILLGFVVLSAADTGFAYSDLAGVGGLEVFTVPIFATGYAVTAYGAALQSELVRQG
jgi:hypothetical protein